MMKQSGISLTIGFALLLSIVFGWIYFDDHAWGAWGDDSAGYLYLAGRMFQGLPLVYQDSLAARGLEFFQDEHLARWLLPTHHQFINPNGFTASKYPIGLPLLMVAAGRLFGSADAFYYVNPFLSTVNVVLVYLFALQLFTRERLKHAIGVAAAVVMGVSNVYYDHAIAQPMRDIPAMTFLLLAAMALVAGCERFTHSKRNRIAWFWLFCAGAAFGFAFSIRETSLVVAPALFLYGLLLLWRSSEGTLRDRLKRLLAPAGVFLAGCILFALPILYNSFTISQHKVAFKARDTGSVVLLSNIGHIQTLDLENAFDNQGKFRPGKGSLPHYWSVMRQVSPVPYFIAIVFFGAYMLWRASKEKMILLVLWVLGILGIYSIWINPYSRYILPLFPPLILLAVYGFAQVCTSVLPRVLPKRTVRRFAVLLLFAGFMAGYQPVFADIRDNLSADVFRFKAISRMDLDILKRIGSELSQRTDEPILMFSGEWQFGTSETFEAHTGVKTVRFPLEQRFTFDESQVNEFFDELLQEDVSLFVWADSTSSGEFSTWLTRYRTEPVGEYDFTFQPDVRILLVRKQ